MKSLFLIFLPHLQCSVTCGEGIQTRSVLCMDNNGFTVADDNCVNAGLVRPADSETCFLGACASYYVGEFAAVSQSIS